MAVYLPALLFITLPFSSYLDATHHWKSIVAATAALAVLLEERKPAHSWRATRPGGNRHFFTQSVDLFAVGFPLFLLWERGRTNQTWRVFLKKAACFLAGFLATVTVCLAYFVWTVGAERFSISRSRLWRNITRRIGLTTGASTLQAGRSCTLELFGSICPRLF